MTTLKRANRLISFLTSVLMLVQPVTPAFPAIFSNPVYATTSESTALSFSSQTANFSFSADGPQANSPVSYVLSYFKTTTNTVEGVVGQGNTRLSKTIMAGTCSKNDCLADSFNRVLTKTVITETSGNWCEVKEYTYDGALHEQGSTVSSCTAQDNFTTLTDSETNWLKSGTNPIPTPTPTVAPTATPEATPTPTPEQGQILDGASTEATPTATPTLTMTPTATPTPEPEFKNHGQLQASIVHNQKINTLNLDSQNVLGSATLTTNKPDYSPTDTVIVTGTGFIPKHDYTLEISSPDPPAVDFTTGITTDPQGSFIYAYQLDGNYRPNYTINVKDGSTIVATTTFTDSIGTDLRQCAQNDKQGNTPLGLGYCNWINSSLGTSNSKLFEGMAADQQLLLTGLTGTSHTLVVGIQATKGGQHAYDWLVSDAVGSTQNSQQTSALDGITLQLNTCGAQLSGAAQTACNNLTSGGNYIDVSVPDDPFISKDGSTQSKINAYESLFGNRTVRIYSSTTITGTPTMTLAHMDGKSSGSVVPNGGDTGDTYIWYTVNWTSSGSSALFLTGADIGLGDNSARGWGTGKGAAGISGDPYHFYLISIDGTGGSLDNQLSANAVIPYSTITIHKTTVPSGGTGFGFTTTGGLSPSSFSLDDGGSTSYTYVVPGSYTITENANAGYNLTDLTCTQSGTGTSAQTDKTTRTVSITIGSSGGGNVDCTYTNTLTAVTPTINTTPNPASGNIGTVLNDSATLSGGNSPTGTITFNLYAPGDTSCQGTVQYTQGVTVSGNGTYSTTPGFTSTTAGTYNWTATYSGDTYNNSATSSCGSEQVTIGKNSTSITTTLSTSTANIGDSVHDSARLTGETSTAGGTVTYHAYAGTNTCTGTALLNSTKTVNNGAVPDSDAISFTSAGTYSFQAVYSGDSNNAGSTSDCTTEQLVVNKAQPSIVTNATPSVTVGQDIKDTATISGLVNPDGTSKITFTLYSDSACKTQVATSDSNFVTANGSYDSGSYTTTAAGTYYWIANFPGDSNNKAVISNCNDANESTVVGKATPTLTTTASGPVTVGDNIHDVAHLSGGYGTLGGSITFDVFAPGDTTCKTPISVSPTKSVSGANDYQSGDYTTTAVGDYRWIAHYSGDSNNNAVDTACNDVNESSATNKATPTLTTTATAGPVTVGDNIHDVAHLSGGYGTLSGSVTFDVFAPGDTSCSTPISVTPAQPVSGTGDYTSGDYATMTVGTYRWIAHYSGDTNNNSVDTSCNDPNESSAVNQSTPTLTTTASGPVTVGQNIHDIAHLSGGYAPLSGTVTFDVFAPGDTSCKTPISVSPPQSVSGTGDYTSGDYATTAVGTYRWIAHYSGDTNNAAVDTACNDVDESSTVNKATPTLSTTATAGPVTVGDTIHDVAHLSGGYPALGGTLTFDVFAPSDTTCSAPISVSPSVSVSGANDYTSGDYTTSAVGTYRWVAHYGGDANNNAVDTSCTDANESSVTQKATPTLTTTASGPVTVGDAIHDVAHLSGGYPTLGGSITFDVFAPGDTSCSTPTAIAGQSVTGTGDYQSSDYTTATVGDYRWIAHYSGDSNNNSVDTACNDAYESSATNKATPAITTSLYNADKTALANGGDSNSGSVYDSASVTGGYSPTGDVAFRFYDTQAACTADKGFTGGTVEGIIGLSGNTAGPSDTVTGLSAGNYSFKAQYAGDTNNNSVMSDCEPFYVSTLTVNKTLSPSADPGKFDLQIDSTTYATDVGDGGTTGAQVVTSGAHSIDELSGTGTTLGDYTSTYSCSNQASGSGTAGRLSVSAGDAVICTFTNTRQEGYLLVNKFQDDGSNTYATFNSDDFKWGTSSATTTTDMGTSQTLDTGNYNVYESNVTGYQFIGWYPYDPFENDFSCTNLPQGNEYRQLPTNIAVTNGETTEINLCNQLQNPILTISKTVTNTDGSPLTDKTAGGSVKFTITVTATQSAAYNVQVVDLPSKGFNYRAGSATATPFGSLTHVYASPGVWTLGTIPVGQTVTLSYIADIDSGVKPGLYKDLAIAYGCKTSAACSVGDSLSVISNAVNPGYVDPNYVGTQVNIVTDTENSSTLNPQTGEVLGASTELPATGADTMWLLIAGLLLFAGITLILLDKKKMKGIMKTILLFAGLLAASSLFAHTVFAANVSVRVEQPKSPTNQNDFPLHFVALDVLGRTVTVTCYKEAPGESSYTQFGSSQVLPDGGNNGYCQTSGVLSSKGTYNFEVTATAGSDTATGTVSVAYDNSGPGDVFGYSKDHNSCQYVIHFTTANDSGATVKVELYRSDAVPFTADTSTRVQTISAGSNETHAVTDTPPDCSKTYYYAVRAFNAAGNGSALVGDNVTNETVITPTPGQSAGAIPVSGTNGNVLGVQTGPTGATGTAGEGGQVEGESTPSAEVVNLPPKNQPYYVAHPKRTLAIAGGILVVIGAALYVFWTRRKNK